MLWVGMQISQPYWEKVQNNPRKSIMYKPYDAATSILNIYDKVHLHQKTGMHKNAQSSTVCKSKSWKQPNTLQKNNKYSYSQIWNKSQKYNLSQRDKS